MALASIEKGLAQAAASWGIGVQPNEFSAFIASEANQSIAPHSLKHGLLRRFASLHKRFAFVAGNDAVRPVANSTRIIA